ncbi:MAG: Gfo/Idh/MocA family protein [Candidatus Methylomirabilales bacterium]
MSGLKVMVWGAGFFTRKWLEAIRAREDCEVVGIASRSRERASELLGELGLGGTTVHEGWEQAAERGKAEAVLITLPQALHPEATVRALKGGWHVLVEKPLALDLKAARTVHSATRRHAGQVVMVNQNFRWRPHVQALRHGIRAGLIGRVGHVMMECRQQLRRKTVDGWRERMAEPFLLDYAIHHFDMMRYLLADEPRAVLGKSFRPSWSWFEGNPSAAAVVEMQGGAVIDYGGTMASLGLETPQEGIVTVIGEKGTLCLDGNSHVQLVAGGETRTLPPEPIAGGELGHALGEFLSAIRERRQPETHVAEHIRSLALTLAVVESSKTGKAVEVGRLVRFLES